MIFSIIGLTYAVKKTNLNYINALIKYGQYVRIQKINDEKIEEHEGQPLSAKLQEIMDAASDNEQVILKCDTTDSSSAVGVLPKISSKALLKCVPQELSASDEKIINQSVGIIGTYLKQVTDPHRNWDRIGEPPILDVDIVDINYIQAVHIFEQLQREFDKPPELRPCPSITGCMHISEINTILFQIDTAVFILKYGENSSYGECFPFYFHAGIGFGPNNALLKTPKDHPILLALQKHFLTWKNNNYQGEVISSEQAGFIHHQKKRKEKPKSKTTTFWNEKQNVSEIHEEPVPTLERKHKHCCIL